MIDVVGLGDSGLDDVPERLRRLIVGAEVLLGGRRHLDMVPPVVGQTRHPWPSPMRPQLPGLLAEVDAYAAPPGRVVALASGDPLLSGVGTSLVELLGVDRVSIHPTVSAETLARARMGWSAQQSRLVSVVGRDPDRIRRHLDPGARLVVLCSDGQTPARLARILVEEGAGASRMTAWWHLGGPQEGLRIGIADAWDPTPTPSLVVLCVEIEVVPTGRSMAVGPAPGRAECHFAHDGQITKRDVRASALAHLRPTGGGLLWDIGAGAGSIGIEWALAASGARTIAVERDPERAARISTNAARLGVPTEIEIVQGDALTVLPKLRTPDAVFIGGGLTATLVERAWSRLRCGGRIVAHAVTLGSEGVLVEALGRFGGELTRISVEHAQPLGRYLSWTPAHPVVQWSATKSPEPTGEPR